MKRYGLRIGDVGVEFPSAEDREKALRLFTKGTDVTIHKEGIRYRDGEGTFSVYDRDTKEVLTNCCICNGVFTTETCPNREYPYKRSWEKEFASLEGYICDACLASQERAEKVFEAKQVLDAAKGEEE